MHDYAKSYIATDLIQYFYRVAACANETAEAALFLRYPGDQGWFIDAALKPLVCNYDTQELADLTARIATNNRSK